MGQSPLLRFSRFLVSASGGRRSPRAPLHPLHPERLALGPSRSKATRCPGTSTCRARSCRRTWRRQSRARTRTSRPCRSGSRWMTARMTCGTRNTGTGCTYSRRRSHSRWACTRSSRTYLGWTQLSLAGLGPRTLARPPTGTCPSSSRSSSSAAVWNRSRKLISDLCVQKWSLVQYLRYIVTTYYKYLATNLCVINVKCLSP